MKNFLKRRQESPAPAPLSPLDQVLSEDGRSVPDDGYAEFDAVYPDAGGPLARLLDEEPLPEPESVSGPVFDPFTSPVPWVNEPALVADLIAAEMGIDWRSGDSRVAVAGGMQGRSAAEWVSAVDPEPTGSVESVDLGVAAPDGVAGLYCETLKEAS